MSLKLRPTGLGSGAGKDKDDPDFVVSAKANRRIYERRGLPDDVRWSWSLYGVVRTRPPDTCPSSEFLRQRAVQIKRGSGSFG
jgi:hypothetical protein